ncbi:MAG: AIDA repeat-containing protein [Lentisphaeria bacterium]|nr:AIDA repeat-containing protein [Lentisphaeria bacterium]
MASYYVSSGVTSTGVVVAKSSMYVSSGGTANSTTVNSRGSMYVYGGTANSTTVNSRGCLEVSGGGTANSTTVNSRGYLEVSSGGTANSTTVNSGGSMWIDGGTAAAIIENGGYVGGYDANITFVPNTFSGLVLFDGVTVHSGTTAAGTTLSGCDMYVCSGGTANSTTMSGGSMIVSRGGTVDGATVNSGGAMYVCSGGTVNSAAVSSGGYMYVESGGTALDIDWTPFVGRVIVGYDATATFAGSCSGVYFGSDTLLSSAMVMEGIVISDYHSMYVMSGGTANSTALSGGWMIVSSGGTANSTTVDSCGRMTLSRGGTASRTAINYGCEMDVSSGGTASVTTVNSYGELFVSSGGTASVTTVNSGGRMTVSSGGTATDVIASSGALLELFVVPDTRVKGTFAGSAFEIKDARFSGCTVRGGIVATVGSGGTADTITVDRYGELYVSGGGTANSTTVNSDGSMTVFGGGSANRVTVDSGGELYISSGGTATDLVVISGACMELIVAPNTWIRGTYADSVFEMKNGMISGCTVTDYWDMFVSSGGTANRTTVGSDGRMYVSSGGTANSTTVNSGGRMVVRRSGGTANSTTVNSGGSMSVWNGTATAIVENGGYVDVDDEADVTFASNVISGLVLTDKMSVHSGTTAVSTAISYGDMCVFSGGTANGTTVNRHGGIYVESGGTANSTTVNSGGELYVSSGGIATGRLEIAGGGIVSAEEGGIIDFDVSGIAPGNTVLVNDLSRIEGAPSYTLTVSGRQAAGAYALAGGAANFAAMVSVGTATEDFGIAVINGSPLSHNNCTYTLTVTDSTLTLLVEGGGIPPIAVSGDLNGDGRADVIMSVTQSGHGAEGATGAWLIQNDQTAAWGDLSQRNPGWEIFGTGITDAGKATNDVYVKSSDNIIGAWVTNDSGHVAGWTTIGQFDDATRILGLGDFNADGQTDLLLRNVNGAVGCFFTSGPITGWNYFQSLGDEWKITAVGDLNGDGRDDVVLKHDAGFAGSWLTQSDGTMVWADLDTLPAGFAVVGCGDFDGDGVDDVLLKKDTYYGAWLAQNGSVKSWFGIGDLGNVTVEQIADFDGDGKDDLRIRTSAGDLGAQLVRAADTLEWRYYGSVGAEWSTSLAVI